jgi:hypothetical protein
MRRKDGWRYDRINLAQVIGKLTRRQSYSSWDTGLYVAQRIRWSLNSQGADEGKSNKAST